MQHHIDFMNTGVFTALEGSKEQIIYLMVCSISTFSRFKDFQIYMKL